MRPARRGSIAATPLHRCKFAPAVCGDPFARGQMTSPTLRRRIRILATTSATFAATPLHVCKFAPRCLRRPLCTRATHSAHSPPRDLFAWKDPGAEVATSFASPQCTTRTRSARFCVNPTSSRRRLPFVWRDPFWRAGLELSGESVPHLTRSPLVYLVWRSETFNVVVGIGPKGRRGYWDRATRPAKSRQLPRCRHLKHFMTRSGTFRPAFSRRFRNGGFRRGCSHFNVGFSGGQRLPAIFVFNPNRREADSFVFLFLFGFPAQQVHDFRCNEQRRSGPHTPLHRIFGYRSITGEPFPRQVHILNVLQIFGAIDNTGRHVGEKSKVPALANRTNVFSIQGGSGGHSSPSIFPNVGA